MSLLQLDEFKTRQRATWEGGDYSACTPHIAEVGELVVSRAGSRHYPAGAGARRRMRHRNAAFPQPAPAVA